MHVQAQQSLVHGNHPLLVTNELSGQLLAHSHLELLGRIKEFLVLVYCHQVVGGHSSERHVRDSVKSNSIGKARIHREVEKREIEREGDKHLVFKTD